MTIQTALVRVAAIAALALSASSCAANFYPTVKAGEPAAELTFYKTYSGTNLAVSAAQSYNLGPDEFCDTVKIGAMLYPGTGRSKTLRLAPGRPVVIWATTNDAVNYGSYMRTGTCTNVVRLTPEQGRQYDIRHDADRSEAYCRLVITDGVTGQVVRDGVEVLPLDECRKRAAE